MRGFGDALGGRDQANLQAIIERVWRYTLRRYLGGFGDALGGRNRASLETDGGHDRASLVMYLEVVV